MGLSRSHRVLLLIAALAVHLPLLLNDGIYWDSWLIHYPVQQQDRFLTTLPFARLGVPFIGYFYWFFASWVHPLSFKAISFLAIVSAGWSLARISYEGRFLGREEALVFGIGFFVIPCYRVHAVDVHAPYIAGVALFLLAVRIVISGGAFSWKSDPGRRAAVIVLFVLALALYAPLLVFYFGFLGLWWTARRESVPTFLRAAGELLILPFVFHVTRSMLFPAWPAFQDYAIKLDPHLWLEVVVEFWRNAILQNALLVLRVFGRPRFVLILGVLVVAAFLGARRVFRNRESGEELPLRPMPFLFCVALGFLAMAPFALTGRVPAGIFWWERYNLLLCIPLSLAVVLGLRLVSSVLGRMAVGASERRAARVALLVPIALVCWCLHAHAYLMLQARWISHQALALSLKESLVANDTTFFVVDETPFTRDAGYMFHTSYTWAMSWSYFGFGQESKTAFDREVIRAAFCRDENEPLERRVLGYTRVPLDGKWARLVESHGPGAPFGAHSRIMVWAELSARYTLIRLFRPSEMNGFLRSVSDPIVTPIDLPETRNACVPGAYPPLPQN